MKTQETIIEKITKLLAKAESTTHDAEAELLRQKAADLMQAYSIDQAMLAAAGQVERDKPGTRRISLAPFGAYAVDIRDLILYVGQAFGFRLLADPRSKPRQHANVIWIGFENDLKLADLVLGSLLIQEQRAREAYMRTTSEPDRGIRTKMRRSFIIGFGERAGDQIAKARKDALKNAEAATPGAGLVLANRDGELDHLFDLLSGGKLRSGSRSVHRGAYGAGQEAGDRVDTELRNRVAGTHGALNA